MGWLRRYLCWQDDGDRCGLGLNHSANCRWADSSHGLTAASSSFNRGHLDPPGLWQGGRPNRCTNRRINCSDLDSLDAPRLLLLLQGGGRRERRH